MLWFIYQSYHFSSFFIYIFNKFLNRWQPCAKNIFNGCIAFLSYQHITWKLQRDGNLLICFLYTAQALHRSIQKIFKYIVPNFFIPWTGYIQSARKMIKTPRRKHRILYKVYINDERDALSRFYHVHHYIIYKN